MESSIAETAADDYWQRRVGISGPIVQEMPPWSPMNFFAKDPSIIYHWKKILTTFTVTTHSLQISLLKILQCLSSYAPQTTQSLSQLRNPTFIKTATDAPKLSLPRALQVLPSQSPVAWAAIPITPPSTDVAPASAACGYIGPRIQHGHCQSSAHLRPLPSCIWQPATGYRPHVTSSSQCWTYTWRPLSQLSACICNQPQPTLMALFLTATCIWGTASPKPTTSSHTHTSLVSALPPPSIDLAYSGAFDPGLGSSFEDSNCSHNNYKSPHSFYCRGLHSCGRLVQSYMYETI